jgi:TrmH family RNA methyltransferase
LPDTSELDHICIVLVSTRNPLNIGAAARAMSNFGFRRLRIVNPFEPSFREARSAVGASSILAEAQEFPSVRDAVADCTLVVGTTAARDRDLQHPLRTLPVASRIIHKEAAAGRVAILFGSEKRGLSTDDLSHCHWSLRIPTREEHPSMNLGQAVAVCLYELVRTKTSKVSEQPVLRATAAEVARLTGVLLEALQASGYVKPRTEKATEDKVRHLLQRFNLASDDAELLLGMVRKMLWKMKSQ